MEILTLAQLQSRGQSAEYLFWVGCAGSFDDRAKKVTLAVTQILQHAGLSFAVLGTEESCTGDPARRSGNEFLFQMQASQNISTLNAYGVKKIVTACPHCFNTLRNEYPELGGQYDVVHHSTLIQQLINEGRLRLQDGGPYKGRRVWERLTLKHVNDTTVRIARGNLSAICRAVGVMAPNDSSELHDLPLSITVALRKRDDNGEMANVVKGFAKREAPASTPRAAAGGAPWKR